jgi:hypothetical protein
MPQGGITHLDAQITQDALSKFSQRQILLLANPGS